MKNGIIACLTAASMALAPCGCISILERSDDYTTIRGVYQPTRVCAESIALPFREKRTGEGAVAQSVCTLLLPFTLVDFPLDVVADTLCLPWDAYCAHQRASEPEEAMEEIENVEGMLK